MPDDNTTAGPPAERRDDRPTPADRTEAPDRTGAPDRPTSSDRRTSPDRRISADRTGASDRAESAGPTETPDRTGTPDRAEAAGRTGTLGRTEAAGRTGTPGRTEAIDRAEAPGRSATSGGVLAPDTGSGTPAPSGARGTARPAHDDRHMTTAGSPTAPEGTPVPGTHGKATPETAGGTRVGGRLMSPDAGDKWTLQLQHAVAGFIDGPRGSVEEADKVLQEVAARFTDAVTERRRTLRTSWQTTGEDKADTEQLRLVLRDYRELAERLLRL